MFYQLFKSFCNLDENTVDIESQYFEQLSTDTVFIDLDKAIDEEE